MLPECVYSIHSKILTNRFPRMVQLGRKRCEIMDKRLGFLFVAIGMCFLMLTLTMNVQNVAWTVMLGVSIVSNVTGTTLLFKYIREYKKQAF